ncbi:MAG: DUF5723 family protein [Prevotellaceae bacterium]|jgi:hypothetical protein|nr:DUF5723 family protein [Prevotellaceae bacterium]
MKFSCQIKKGVALMAWTLALSPRYGAQAQHNATMFFMRDLPAVNMLNPAFQPEAGSIYVGIPLLSSIYLDGGVTLKGMNMGDILSGSLPLTSAAANPSPYEGAYANVDINLLNIGILMDDIYLTLDITEKTRAEIALPGEFVKLAWHGNAPYIGKVIPLSGLGGRATSYAEIALGLSKDVVRDRITIGGKIKRLLGVTFADVSMGAVASLQTDHDWSTTMVLDPEFNIAGIPETMPKDLRTYKFAGKGWGVDLGFDIKNEQFIASGSIVNVGAITWSNVRHEKAQNVVDIAFRGVPLGDNSYNIVDTLKGAIETAQNEMESNSEHVNIRRWTDPTITVGVACPLNKHLAAGALAGITIGQYNSYPLFALSLNTWRYPINGSLSYSYGHSHNLGLGLLFGRREAQLHVICDNILAANYQTAQKINLRVGLSLLLGAPREPGNKKKRWLQLNTASSPENTYKNTEKRGPLHLLSPATAQPVSKQPLHPLSPATAQPVSKQPLNPLESNPKPAPDKKPLNPSGGGK